RRGNPGCEAAMRRRTAHVVNTTCAVRLRRGGGVARRTVYWLLRDETDVEDARAAVHDREIGDLGLTGLRTTGKVELAADLARLMLDDTRAEVGHRVRGRADVVVAVVARAADGGDGGEREPFTSGVERRQLDACISVADSLHF